MTAEETVVPTKYWHVVEDGRIQCDVCPRYCKLQEGQRGMCFVRMRQDDRVVLTTYGRSSGYCVDPIEKKPLNHFLPGTPILSFGTAGCNLACKFCFHPDTLVATTKGMRRIEDLFDACEEVVEGHDGRVGFPRSLEVWTRAARRAPVAKVFAHSYSGEILSIKASCCPSIRLTPNHRVFAAHRSNRDDVHLVRADGLTTEHYLVVPKRCFEDEAVEVFTSDLLEGLERGAHAARPRRIAFEELTAALATGATSKELGALLGYHPAYVRKLRGQFARGVLAPQESRPISTTIVDGRVRYYGARVGALPPRLHLTTDLAWLLGYYCAEGYVTANPRRPNSHSLGFTSGHHERHLAERAATILADVFDVQPHIAKRRTTITVSCTVTAVARVFEALCGRGATNKRVPAQLANASEPVIRAFLDGYFAGDGYTSETQVVAGTVSRELALGLYELGLHLDVLPTFFVHEPSPTKEIEGRIVLQSTTYIVKYQRDRFEGTRQTRAGHTIWYETEDYFLVPVRGVEREPYTGTVYNLEVDDTDHSYLAPFLAVSNCQNWDMSKSREMDTLADQAAPETIARAAKELGCSSVAFTYNDPTIFLEYAIDVADACHEQGVKAVAVTAGYICDEPRRELYSHLDAANVDLKGFTEEFYHKVTASHLEPVLETLVYLKEETDVWFELTTLLIPGLNDSERELEEMTQWVVEKLGPDVPMHFTAFHPDYKMTDTPPTPPATLSLARRIAMKNGVRYAYTGNVHDEDGGSTYCHECGQKLVGRDWYIITAWNLTADGACASCGAQCAGVFAGGPGRWGARRMPVRLANFRSN